MARLPALTAKKIIQALKRKGFIEDRQKGSHLMMIHPYTKARTVIPVHRGKSLKRSLVFGIINDAQITVEEFLKLL